MQTLPADKHRCGAQTELKFDRAGRQRQTFQKITIQEYRSTDEDHY